MPKNLNNNSTYEITLDRNLLLGIMLLYVAHNLNHKQPGKLLIPLLNLAHKDVKLPEVTILGSLNWVHDVDSIQEVSWKKIQDVKNEAIGKAAQELQTPKLLPSFPECSNFQIHAKDDSSHVKRWKHSTSC